MINDDPHGIVPGGSGAGRSRSVNLQVRTLLEYDVVYGRDRVRSDIFIDNHPVGASATAAVDEDLFFGTPASAVLDQHADWTERAAIEEFVGLRYRQELGKARTHIQVLETRIESLEARLETRFQALAARLDRPRWWQWRRLWSARKAARS